MLARVAVFAVVLSVVAVAAPRVAPGLLSALVSPDVEQEAQAPVARPQPVRSARRDPEPDQPRTSGRKIVLRANSRGHYLAKASINGRSLDVIVDTGATSVAISDETARRLGVAPPRSAYTMEVGTANGSIRAAPVTLNEVRIGNLSVRNVRAVVLPGEALPVSLLGMSFLGRLSKFESAGGQLVLSQ